jgi:Leucine-rich repeat (LRR) protein
MDSDSLFCVFNFLKIRDIHNCLLTNKQFNNVAQNELIWKRLHEIDFYSVQMKNNYSNYKKCYILNIGLNQLNNSINSDKLNLGFKNINRILPDLFSLTHVIHLLLHYSNLKILSSDIGQLTNLRVLSLIGNYLMFVPKEIGLLNKLKYLHLDENILQSIPEEIGLLTNLVSLSLMGNPLKVIPREINKLNNTELVLCGKQRHVTHLITIKMKIL